MFGLKKGFKLLPMSTPMCPVDNSVSWRIEPFVSSIVFVTKSSLLLINDKDSILSSKGIFTVTISTDRKQSRFRIREGSLTFRLPSKVLLSPNQIKIWKHSTHDSQKLNFCFWLTFYLISWKIENGEQTVSFFLVQFIAGIISTSSVFAITIFPWEYMWLWCEHAVT